MCTEERQQKANLVENAILQETAYGKEFQNWQQLVKAGGSLVFHFLGSEKKDQEKLAISLFVCLYGRLYEAVSH